MDDISREFPSDVPERAPRTPRKGPAGALDDAMAEETSERDVPAEPNRLAALASTGGAPESQLDEGAPPIEDPVQLARVLMAVLLTSREPVSMLRLAQAVDSDQKTVAAGLEQLASDLREGNFPLEVSRVGESVRLLTVPEVFPYLRRLQGVKKADRLSPAALETLAVVAYRQPVIRAEIEAIRGVKVGPTLRTLLDHKFIAITGRADVPGRPLQYGTTEVFLDRFGLSSVKDLPSVREVRALD